MVKSSEDERVDLAVRVGRKAKHVKKLAEWREAIEQDRQPKSANPAATLQLGRRFEVDDSSALTIPRDGLLGLLRGMLDAARADLHATIAELAKGDDGLPF